MNNKRSRTSQYVSYEEASRWAKDQKIVSGAAWRRLKDCLPESVPLYPEVAYKKQNKWVCWNTFLQNHKKPRNTPWMTYEQASSWAQDNHIKSARQWYLLKDKKPPNAPSNPDLFYTNEWEGWTKFLNNHVTNGASMIERLMRLVLDEVFAPDEESHRKQFVTDDIGKRHAVDMMYPQINLVIEYDGAYFHQDKEKKDKSKTKSIQKCGWNVIRIRENGLPILDKKWNVVIPRHTTSERKIHVLLDHLIGLCNKGLISITSMQEKHLNKLLNETRFTRFFAKISTRSEFISYEDCQKWAFDRGIKGESHWRTFKSEMIAARIPYHPERTYRQEWVNWPTFLQNGQRSKKENWASYEECSGWAQAHGVKSAKQWYGMRAIIPNNMPINPDGVYRNDWISWPDFLKNGKRKRGQFVSYQEASLWARQNNIKTGSAWKLYKDRPCNIPACPANAYKEWSGWGAFLGVENNYSKNKKWISYEEASLWARKNGIKSSSQWKVFVRPSSIPRRPNMAYKHQWKSWSEFFCV